MQYECVIYNPLVIKYSMFFFIKEDESTLFFSLLNASLFFFLAGAIYFGDARFTRFTRFQIPLLSYINKFNFMMSSFKLRLYLMISKSVSENEDRE